MDAKAEIKSVLICACVNIDVFNIDVWFRIPVC